MTDFAQTRIERPELTGRLAAGLDRGSLLLLADAGFGKTTALEDALSERDGSAVWLRATEADRDPGRLVARLVDRVRTGLPGVGDEHADRLARAIEPLDPTAVAQDLLAELERLLVEPLVVVIDDAEHLDGASSLGIVDELLAAGDPIRVAICSRRSLGLRLAKLRANGRLRELGPADLAFSPAECAGCVRAVRGREPDGDEVERLFDLTHGWPLAVALAAAAEPGAGELAPASRDAIFAYLAEEVLEGLDPELRERLCAASVVDELSSEVERALGLPASFRDDLVASGISVRAHDGAAYAIHPQLRGFLRARLAEDRPADELADLRRRAAAALAAAGRASEAIELWLAAGAFDEAADAIAAHGIALVGVAPDTVGGWLARLPPQVRGRPILSVLAGRLAMGEGDFERAVRECRSAVAELESAGAPAAMVWAARLALTEAQLAALDLEAALEASAGAEAAGPEGGAGAAFCALGRVATLARLGRREEAERALETALAQPRGQELLGPGLPAFRAHSFELPAGRVDAALEHVNAGIAALRAGGMLNRLPYVLAFKMAIHEARGERDEVLMAFEELLDTARRTGLAGYVGAGARLAAATTLAQLGRTAEARTQLERVAGYGSWAGCDNELAEALLAGRAGDARSALGFGRRALEEAQRMPPFDRVRVAAVLAPVLCDAGEPALAREGLEAVLAALSPGESTARTRTALACVLHRSGDAEGAHAALAAALEEAGADRRFVLRSEWPQVEPVLWSALEAGALEAPPAIAALEEAFPGGPEVVAFAEHPRPEVRDAALLAAAASGRPEALARLADAPDGDGPARVARDRLLRQPPPLAFRTLGRFEVRRAAWVADAAVWERRVAERVVRYLLVRAGEFVPEDELFEAFWPDKSPASGRRGLQTAISSARSAIDLPWEESRLVAGERAYALLLRERDTVDADAFEVAAARALATEGPERVARLEAATRIWTGEPLSEERYSDWAASWRERLSSLHADVLTALAEAHGRRGEHPAAVRAARALVDLDPLDEHSQRLLIGAYAAAGRRGDALRQFLECRRALVEQLGIEPEAETLALHRRILAGEAPAPA
jgi:ATP/maltotriose-dependent transcriptional regulator MalT/DNA-binding SARP family transcriptional activator